ncbi:hypothetical protein WICPIJ_004557 [Wickerhamomyces pijperi]|uniref:non-specific serine/threonine protein kinase n=1 Tax=Wickerhamomyces pijperi TaxID=599730 RepID=A0A9P8Q597_WICPI|nr:hypothetical protein WICPIJ_004557 [Wickerhamomyces pijperi]
MLQQKSSMNPFSRNPFLPNDTTSPKEHPQLHRFDSFQQPSTISPPATSPLKVQESIPKPKFLNKSTRANTTQVIYVQQESSHDYRYGGYHSTKENELLGPMNQYVMIKKLGWGQYSTVWLVFNKFTSEYLALKIIRSDRVYSLAALDEVKLLQALKADVEHKEYLIEYKEAFWHKGPNGKHCCLVFELLGENLLQFVHVYQDKTPLGGLPLPLAKSLIKQVLLGVSQLHQRQLIHTDIKPENILITLTKQDRTELNRLLDTMTPSSESTTEINLFHELHMHTLNNTRIPLRFQSSNNNNNNCYQAAHHSLRGSVSSIGSTIYTAEEDEEEIAGSNYTSSSFPSTADSNSSCVVSCSETDSDYDSDEEENEEEEEDHQKTKHPQQTHTTTNTSSELLTAPLKIKIADLGNTTSTSKHHTSDIQTCQYRSPEVILQNQYGASVDIWSVGCMLWELITGERLFEPKGVIVERDQEHLEMIIAIVDVSSEDIQYLKQSERFPVALIDRLNVQKQKITELLRLRSTIDPLELQNIGDLISGMLQIQPKNRKTCVELLKESKWLREVLSKEELEVLKKYSHSKSTEFKGWCFEE